MRIEYDGPEEHMEAFIAASERHSRIRAICLTVAFVVFMGALASMAIWGS